MYGDFELSMLVIGDPSEEGLCNNNKIINAIMEHKRVIRGQDLNICFSYCKLRVRTVKECVCDCLCDCLCD